MRYTVTAYTEQSFKPETELVGDNMQPALSVCARYANDQTNMAHSVYIWDWHELTLSEYVAGALLPISK
jgi:hypothetical protein